MLHSADPAPPTPHSPAPSVSFVMNVLKITTIIITSRGESSAVYKATLPSQGPSEPPRGQPWGPELALVQPLQTWLCRIPPWPPPTELPAPYGATELQTISCSLMGPRPIPQQKAAPLACSFPAPRLSSQPHSRSSWVPTTFAHMTR